MRGWRRAVRQSGTVRRGARVAGQAHRLFPVASCPIATCTPIPDESRMPRRRSSISIPTLMYRSYQYSGDAPPLNNLAGDRPRDGGRPRAVGRRDLQPSRDPRRPRRLGTTCGATGSSSCRPWNASAIRRSRCSPGYVQSGGTLGLIGPCGERNEDNLPRQNSPVDTWRKAGRVVDILPGQNFLPVRAKEVGAHARAQPVGHRGGSRGHRPGRHPRRPTAAALVGEMLGPRLRTWPVSIL